MNDNKRNRFIVIGNGFDLHCGLKSTYTNFFEGDDDTRIFKKILKETESYEDKNKRQYRLGSILARLPKINFWMLYFLERLYCSDVKIGENWMDIEQLIKDFFFSQPAKYPATYFQALQRNKAAHQPTHNNFELDALEMVLNHINPQGCETEMEFASLLLDQLKEFEIGFGGYITYLQDLGQGSYQSMALLFLKRLLDDSNLVAIDTFNYSDPFDQTDFYWKMRHIHGDVRHPIFGININASDSKREDDPSYIFTKKSRQLELDDPKIDISFPDIDEVMIFGHSLNEQDQGYFQGLFDLLRIRDLSINKPKLIFCYCLYSNYSEAEVRAKTLRNVTNLFKRYEKNKGDDNIMQALKVAYRIELKRVI